MPKWNEVPKENPYETDSVSREKFWDESRTETLYISEDIELGWIGRKLNNGFTNDLYSISSSRE